MYTKTIQSIVVFLFVILPFNKEKEVSYVEYGVSITTNTLNKVQNNNEKLITGALNNAESMSLDLIFSKTESIFQQQKALGIGEEDITKKLTKILSGVKGKYYRNIKDNVFLLQKTFLSDLYLIDINSKNQDWALTKETKYIGKYKCFKAILKETYKTRSGESRINTIVAWYTPEISAPFGPLSYGDLPGLILELSKKHTTYYAKNITLKSTKYTINKPEKGKKITLEQYNNLAKKVLSEKGF